MDLECAEGSHTHEGSDVADVDLAKRPGAGRPFTEVLDRRVARRAFLQASAAGTAGLLLGQAAPAKAQDADPQPSLRPSSDHGLTFQTLNPERRDQVSVPEGYGVDIIIRWGDSLDPAVPSLDTAQLGQGALLEDGAGARQAAQFGFNCDATAFFPIRQGGARADHGLICVNHESTEPHRVFPGFDDGPSFASRHSEYVPVELAAHGISVVEVKRGETGWGYRQGSEFNRRITGATPIALVGPAAGHALLSTKDDPEGRTVLGTLNNCAGGQTPWGTYLSAEENIDQYFGGFAAYGASPDADPEVLDAHRRLPLPPRHSPRGWEVVEARFDVAQSPTEALRFGWVVEVDPYDPQAQPRKQTALGRFKHECATTILAADNRCVVYSGDDAQFEYMYKFVSARPYDPSAPRSEHLRLLEEGTLYAARLEEDGSGVWLPLVWGQGPLTEERGFKNQAEVLIKARHAADLLGATPMDRPEDFEANPVTKKVYCALTNNTRRQDTEPGGTLDAQGRTTGSFPTSPNPRGENRFGHVLELTEAGDDNGATSFTWEIFLLCGDPSADGEKTVLARLGDVPLTSTATYFGGFTGDEQEGDWGISALGSPDNLGFDNQGNLWIVTDGDQPRGTNNGCFAVPTTGPERGRVRQFLEGPNDCEVCGCAFNPDNTALFLTIQHPGNRGPLEAPTSYWPDSTIDGGDFAIPRPSLVAVRGEGAKTGFVVGA